MLNSYRTRGSLTVSLWWTVHCPNWTWTLNRIKSAVMKTCVNHMYDPFEPQLQEKDRMQVHPANSWNILWLPKLQNETCLSDTGLCGDTGTGVASDPVADTSAQTLSVLIWNLCPLNTSCHCIPPRHSHRACRHAIGPIRNPCPSGTTSGSLEITQDT